jgi:hypothetical protein
LKKKRLAGPKTGPALFAKGKNAAAPSNWPKLNESEEEFHGTREGDDR